MATSSIEERMAHLEGAYEQINHRLGSIEQQLIRLDNGISDLRKEMHNQFLWFLGLLLPMWVTIILAVLLRG